VGAIEDKTFVDVAPGAMPSRCYSLDDVGIAQGWRSVESVVARHEPIALVDELREIARRRTEPRDSPNAPNLSALVATRPRRSF
jgi:hypothetical protein